MKNIFTNYSEINSYTIESLYRLIPHAKVKESAINAIQRISESLINKEIIYKRISLFPYKYPYDVKEVILKIAKIDGFVVVELACGETSLKPPKYLYKVLEKTTKYMTICTFVSIDYWRDKSTEFEYRKIIKLLPDYKLPEFAENKFLYFELHADRVKRFKNYAIIFTANQKAIFTSKEECIICNNNIAKLLLSKIRLKKLKKDEVFETAKKESILYDFGGL